RLGVRRGHGDDGNIEPLASGDPFEILDVVDRHPSPRLVSNLLVCSVEQRRDFKPFLAESRIVRECQTQIARADDRDAQPPIEAEDLAKVAPQFLDVVADTAYAEFTEVGEVFSNLRGVEVKLFRQCL